MARCGPVVDDAFAPAAEVVTIGVVAVGLANGRAGPLPILVTLAAFRIWAYGHRRDRSSDDDDSLDS